MRGVLAGALLGVALAFPAAWCAATYYGGLAALAFEPIRQRKQARRA